MSQKKKTNALDFNAGMEELGKIAEWFESENMDLEIALDKFERGMELTRQLQEHLNEAENRIEAIKKKFDSETAVANE